MVLALLVPVAFLLFLLAMERVEARVFPAASTAHPGEPHVDRPSGDAVVGQLPMQAPAPVAGGMPVRAVAQEAVQARQAPAP